MDWDSGGCTLNCQTDMIPVKNHFKHDHVKLYAYPLTPATRAKESIFVNVRVDFHGIYFLEGNDVKKNTDTLNWFMSGTI